jgi:hypothetical protein
MRSQPTGADRDQLLAQVVPIVRDPAPQVGHDARRRRLAAIGLEEDRGESLDFASATA